MTFDYIIADTHFGHDAMLKHETKRTEKMKEERYNHFDKMMIDLWNKSIDKDSSILHLGDFALKEGYLQANKVQGNITSILERIYELAGCKINIHGHTHSQGSKMDFCKSACIELNNFKPLSMKDVEKFLEKDNG